MPFFSDAPQAQPRALLINPGSKTFLLGGQANQGGEMNITSAAVASNVVTLGVSAWSGVSPVVGTVVSVRGTTQNSGALNVTDVALTGVTLDASGSGTVTYALTTADLATIAAGGKLAFAPQVAGEVIVAGATIAGSPAFNQGRSQNNYFAQLLTPTDGSALPTAATFTPQHSMTNRDADFVAITGATTLTIVAGAITAGASSFATDAPFVRLASSGVTNTSGKAALAITF